VAAHSGRKSRTIVPVSQFRRASTVEEQSHLGDIRTGTDLRFWLGNADATATFDSKDSFNQSAAKHELDAGRRERAEAVRVT
jgi:hypothetical protein